MTDSPVLSRPRALALIVGAIAVGAAAAVIAQGNFDKVEVKSEKLADHVWVLYGAGGNIGLTTGADGAVMIDDQFAPLSAKITAAVKQITDEPVRWIVNTHWHGDHTGGNENFATAGATIVAQDNVRIRLVQGQHNEFFKRDVPPAVPRALPVVTFNDTTTLHVDGDDLVAFHVAPAHTDGDVIVWFKNANVVHMGDTFFQGMYPIIDLESGGSIDGMIAASARVLPLLKPDTKVIPGHGKVSDAKGLEAYHDMLVGCRAAVAKLVKEKKTLEEAKAAKPTAPWDDAFGKGFVTPDMFTTLLYTELSKKK